MRKVIAIRFRTNGCLGEKVYSYFTDLEVKVGDWVIVEVSKEFKTAMVTDAEGLSKADIAKAHKWIVQKVEVAEYEKRAIKERKINELRNQLRARKEEAEEYLIYEHLAKTDPGIAGLLRRLQELDPDSVPKISSENMTTFPECPEKFS